MKKTKIGVIVITFIGLIVLFIIFRNITNTAINNETNEVLDNYTTLLDEYELLSNDNEILRKEIEVVKEEKNSLEIKVVNRESTIEHYKSRVDDLNKELDDFEVNYQVEYSYSYQMADMIIGCYEEILNDVITDYSKVEDKLMTTVLGDYTRIGDEISGLIVKEVNVYMEPNTEHLIGAESIKFEGVIELTGKLQTYYMDYGEYAIIVEDLSSVPHLPCETSSTTIMMVGASETINSTIHNDGDIITVLVDNLSVGYQFGKPLGSYADFVSIDEN